MIRWRPRLVSVLFAVNLLIFLLPLGGIAILRLYESELIRRTETELNVQGAFVSSMFRTELLRRLAADEGSSGAAPLLAAYGSALDPLRARPNEPEEFWTPVEPSLDIARDPILPPAPDPVEPDVPADSLALSAAEQVTPILMNAQRVTLTGIRVTDYRGVVVASTRTDVGWSLAGQEEVGRALRGEHVSRLRERIGEGPEPPIDSISRGSAVRVFVAMPVIEDDRILGAVLLSRTPLDLSKALYKNRFYLVTGGAAILIVLCAVTVLTTLLITRPMKALIRQAEEVTLGAKTAVSVPLSRPGTYEVDLLSRALARMSATLDQRANYIRTFASNVSHEFKTPLASIHGTVELLKDHFSDMSPEDRSNFLHILEQDADRLTRLVRRLLDLARADVDEPGAELTRVAESLDAIARRFRSEDLKITLELSPELPPVAMEPEVLESILSNLIDNARQHGGPNVHVDISAHPVDDTVRNFVEITVQDDGPGVTESDQDRIFTPFFTTARNSGGTGLGLAIVQALVNAHHGSISLEESTSGARFRILLPAGSEPAPPV